MLYSRECHDDGLVDNTATNDSQLSPTFGFDSQGSRLFLRVGGANIFWQTPFTNFRRQPFLLIFFTCKST
jgi:hypothetical protein